MSTIRQKTVVDRLRDMILQGTFSEGDHMQEVPLSEMLNVSRTPIREALVVLDQEGLLQYRPNRGYTVRGFTMEEILDAYVVRESLEGLAARLLAEKGLSREIDAELSAVVADGDRILSIGHLSEEGRRPWGLMNSRFHRTIILATGNTALIDATDRVTRIPLASAQVVHWFDRNDTAGYERLKLVHQQHHEILEAIRSGHAYRAEAKMRDHIYGTGAFIQENYKRKWIELDARKPKTKKSIE
ncbi:GntR family transcriptional regulator [Bradyrhizobium jicamae]|uniref:GntR family transcriptional regulator n=1 Tax=Bradyrhizobium jicamae TaxID=280332 RepID=UPI001BA855FF|nr:GntR family transcriptional regulator [Bradyrhizobium jicamae]MBR0754409.1 GntR family transcriptional regulator [Bradyrhizobium jicamae]